MSRLGKQGYSDKIRAMVRLRVKQIAREKHITMGKLSRQSDVNYRTIQRIFNDPEYMPTVPTLAKIARVLGVTTGELIEDIVDD